MSKIQTFLENILSARYGKDVRQSIHDAIQEIDSVADTAQTSATAQAEAARKSAQTSALNAQETEQFRNETERFRNEAEAITGIGIATTEKAGIVKPDGETLEIDKDGTMRVIGGGGVSDYKELENKPSVNGTELEGDKSLEELGIASKEELDKTNEKVNIIIDNADLGIKNTASGEDIYVTDSTDKKLVEFALYGKATQNTTTGKNVLENRATTQTINGVTFTVNADKSVTANDTPTGQARLNIYSNLELPAGKYKLSGCPSGGKSNTYYFRLRYKNDSSIYFTDTGKGVSFEITETAIVNVFFNIESTVTTTNFTLFPMLCKCDENGNPIGDDTYEPYTNGASPNPDYPQEIEVAGSSGSVKVTSAGKNLWNPNGKSTNVNGVVRSGIVVPKGTYTITNNSSLSVYCRDGINNTESLGTIVSQNSSTFTFNLEGVFWIASNGVVTDIQVEKGAVATEFEPYKETTATIQGEYAGIPVSDGGNYTDSNGQQWICDEIVKYADGSGEYVQKVKFETITSDDITTIQPYNDGNVFVCYKIEAKTKSKVISNRFLGIEFSDRNNLTNIYRCYANSDGKVVFRITSENKYNTVEEFRNLIAEHGINVIYQLITPIYTPLTAEEITEIEKLHTFYPITNISNDFDCGMSVKYLCDSKNYIDSKIAELATAMVNNI